MTSTMRTAWHGLVAAVALTTLAGPALAGAAITNADPATLERGDDLDIAHIEGKTFVDGDVRAHLGGKYAWLLGTSRGDHLVAVNGKRTSVRRIDADGSVTRVLTVKTAASVHLSTNGRKLVVTGITGGKNQPRTVYNAITGKKLASRTFADYPTTLGMKGAKVYYSTWEKGTFTWNFRNGKIKRLTKRPAGAIDLVNDKLATYTGDPYDGGCTKLTTVSDPATKLWKSCLERIDGFSPDGSRIATVDLLSDGLGPNQVTVRTIKGSHLGTYRTTGWFGTFAWEGASTFVTESYGKKRAAWVRCSGTVCENATDSKATVFPRPGLTRGLLAGRS